MVKLFKKNSFFNIPNLLTLLRFILIIPFIYFFSKNNINSIIISFIIYIIASITDYIDGKIARKYNLTTKIGVFLDPLADKFLVIIGFILFSIKNIVFIPLFLIIILIIRESFITFLRIETDFKHINSIKSEDNLKLKSLENNLKYNSNNDKNKNENIKNKNINKSNNNNNNNNNNYNNDNNNELVNLKTSFIAKIKTTIQMFTLSYYFVIYILSFYIKLPSFFYKEISLILFIIIIYFALSSGYKYIIEKKTESLNTLLRFFSSFLYTGYFPIFPGTFSTLVFYLLSFLFFKLLFKNQIYIINQNFLLSTIIYFGLIGIISSILTILIGNKDIELYGKKDPKNFTLDEIAGASFNSFFVFLVFFIFLKFNLKINQFIFNKFNYFLSIYSNHLLLLLIFLINFLFFRFFDIIKPLGIKKLEKLKGGIGILIDDILAGFYSFLTLFLIILAFYVILKN